MRVAFVYYCSYFTRFILYLCFVLFFSICILLLLLFCHWFGLFFIKCISLMDFVLFLLIFLPEWIYWFSCYCLILFRSWPLFFWSTVFCIMFKFFLLAVFSIYRLCLFLMLGVLFLFNLFGLILCEQPGFVKWFLDLFGNFICFFCSVCFVLLFISVLLSDWFVLFRAFVQVCVVILLFISVLLIDWFVLFRAIATFSFLTCSFYFINLHLFFKWIYSMRCL